MGDLVQDLRYAARVLRRAPLFTAVAALTLALGIGANSAIFSVVSAVLLTPLPIPHSERLVFVSMRSAQGFGISVSIPNARDWIRETRAFTAMTAARGVGMNLTGGDRPERVVAQQVLGDYFGALGVAPAAGRAFSAAETELGAPAIAVLSHGFWQSRFGGAPTAVGSTLLLGGRPFTVVGVMPASLDALDEEVDMYLPLGAFPELPWEQRGNSPGLYAVGRARPGVSYQQAAADIERVGREIGARTGEKAVPVPLPLREKVIGDVGPALILLTTAVGLVLLIACANVANLLLARGEARQRELAVRVAIGASRARLVRQLLTESVVLATFGGVLGVALAMVAVRLLRGWLPQGVPGADRIAVDGRVLLFTVALAIGTGLLFGLLPALRASRAGAAEGMREGSRGAGEGRERQRLRGALVVSEVVLAVLLLVGAGLTARSFLKLRAVDPGFDPSDVLVMRVAPSRDRYGEPERWRAFYDQLLTRVRTVPGVQYAGLSSLVPLGGNSNETMVRPEGASPDDAQSVLRQESSPDFFRAMGIRVVRGRTFTEDEARGTLPVAVIDERMAERFWPGEDPIGKRITYERASETDSTPVWRTVVGVVRNVRHYELQSPSRIQVYRPYQQTTRPAPPGLAIFLKTTGDQTAVTKAVRDAVAALDPELPVYGVTTMNEVVGRRVATSGLIGRLLLAFGVAALTLAAIGIYGVMSYTVARRTREIGVRMALGAQPRDVVRLVVGRGGRLTAVGIALGVVGALVAARAIAGTLYGVRPWDPTTFVLAPLVLGAVALVASYVPARRASRVDPSLSLQAE